MNEESLALIVECDEDVAGTLTATLESVSVTAQTSPQHNLDGALVTSFLVVAGLAIKAAPATLRALSDFLTRNRVKRISIGDMVVENPRPQDIDKILERFAPPRP